ncbi:hypothetical protein INR49_002666 [Caranx melampygus]|nr:hypothetical protein INR49_002666 [Caranx melampygus]
MFFFHPLPLGPRRRRRRRRRQHTEARLGARLSGGRQQSQTGARHLHANVMSERFGSCLLEPRHLLRRHIGGRHVG